MAWGRRIRPEIRERARSIWAAIRALWTAGDDPASAEDELLEKELWKAHRDWQLAQRRLDEALGADEVDYAVLTLQAGERRYGMLLRRAKERGLTRPEWRPRPARFAKAATPPRGREEEAGWSGDG